MANSQFLRYCLAGAAGMLFNLALTAVSHEIIGLGPNASFAFALACAYVLNFFLARHLVFQATAGSAVPQAISYALTSLTFRIGEFLAFTILLALTQLPYLLLAGSILMGSFLLKFVVYRTRVFIAV